MPDVFQRTEANLNGVFLAERGKLDFGEADIGTLVQGINFQYSQALNKLFEINKPQGNPVYYYVVGRTQGQGQINRVVGPKQTVKALYTKYGCACKAKENTLILNLETDCSESGDCGGGGGGEPLTYTLKGCVLTQVGISLQAQDMLINETSQLQFGHMECE